MLARFLLRAVPFFALLAAHKSAHAIAKAEDAWQPDRPIAEQLLKLGAAEIEPKFATLVPPSERLDYACAFAALMLTRLHDQPRAEKYLRLALAELKDLRPAKHALDVYVLLMLLAEDRRDIQALLKHGETILPVVEKETGLPIRQRGLVLSMMAGTLYSMGDFPNALRWSKILVQAADEAGDPAMQGQAYFRLAEICYKLGDFQQSEKAALRAKEIYVAAANESGIGDAEKVLGNVKLVLPDKSDAEAHYRKAIAHYDRAHNEHGLANCHFNLGLLLKNAGKTAEAAKTLEESIFHFTKAGSPGGAGMARAYLGATLMDANDLLKARVHLEEAKVLLTKDQELNRLAEVNFMLGTLHEKLKEVGAARAAYEQSLQLYRNVRDGEQVKTVQAALDRLPGAAAGSR